MAQYSGWARDNFRWIGGNDYGGEWMREQAEKLGLRVLVRSSTDQLHNVAVQGQKVALRKLVWTAPHNPEFDQLEWFRFTLHASTMQLEHLSWCHALATRVSLAMK